MTLTAAWIASTSLATVEKIGPSSEASTASQILQPAFDGFLSQLAIKTCESCGFRAHVSAATLKQP